MLRNTPPFLVLSCTPHYPTCCCQYPRCPGDKGISCRTAAGQCWAQPRTVVEGRALNIHGWLGGAGNPPTAAATVLGWAQSPCSSPHPQGSGAVGSKQVGRGEWKGRGWKKREAGRKLGAGGAPPCSAGCCSHTSLCKILDPSLIEGTKITHFWTGPAVAVFLPCLHQLLLWHHCNYCVLKRLSKTQMLHRFPTLTDIIFFQQGFGS